MDGWMDDGWIDGSMDDVPEEGRMQRREDKKDGYLDLRSGRIN